jgi:hypothetical protein
VGIYEWFGQPGKAGKARRNQPSDPVHGRTVAGRVRAVPVVVRDAEPFGTAMMASLGLAALTQSPMSNGNGGHVTQNIGSGIVGRDSRRTGALQEWRGAGAPVAADKRRAALGAQGGPSSQPAFPSTGNTGAPSLINPLTGMDTPYSLRTPGV